MINGKTRLTNTEKNKRIVQNLTKANLNLQKIHKTEIQGNINRP